MPLIVISFFAAFLVERASLRNTISETPAEPAERSTVERGAAEVATAPAGAQAIRPS